MSKETFKEFIRNKPHFAKAVYDGKVTFQKLYEIYDIYGEESELFDQYIDNTESNSNRNSSISSSFGDVLSMFKNIDLNTIQKGVNSLQKAVSLVQEIVPNKQDNNDFNTYDERPINKYYED